METGVRPSDDPRLIQSRAKLSAALIELILEHGWEAIGVRELCQRARVARSTFYLHFNNKEELLETGFNGLRDLVRSSASKNSLRDTGQFGFVDAIAAHIFDNRKLFLALVSGNGGGIVREKFRSLLATLIEEELRACGKSDAPLTHFLSGGFVSMAAFMMAKSASSSATFCERFHELARAMLK